MPPRTFALMIAGAILAAGLTILALTAVGPAIGLSFGVLSAAALAASLLLRLR